jgi:hypothetical protein
MTTQEIEILVATAKNAARTETINYLYPEVIDRPDVAIATARFSTDSRGKGLLLPDHEFVVDSGFFFAPLFSANIYNVDPVFLAADKGHTNFLPVNSRSSAPEGVHMPPVKNTFLPDDNWDDQPQNFDLPVNLETIAWEGDKVYLGLLTDDSEKDIKHLFLHISGLPAIITQRLTGIPISVGRYPVRLQRLEEVAELANPLQPLGRETMTIYRKKKKALEMVADNIFCLSELPRDRVGELESYPIFVQEQLKLTPSLTILTLHLRPRHIEASAFQNCRVETNVLPVWNARRVSLNLKAGDHYQLPLSSKERFLGVWNARRSDELRLREEANGRMPEGSYRVYRPEPYGQLLKALERQLLTLDATIKELSANTELLEEANNFLSIEGVNALSATLHDAKTQLCQAGFGAGEKGTYFLAITPGESDYNYFFDYLVCQNIPSATLESGVELKPAVTAPGGSPSINQFSAILVSPVTTGSAIQTFDFIARKAFVKDMLSVSKSTVNGTV